LLSFELTGWSTVTAISVPAGTMIGFGEKTWARLESEPFCAPEFCATLEFASDEVAAFPPAGALESGDVVELRQPIKVRTLAIMR
jgi:hypothetical protein